MKLTGLARLVACITAVAALGCSAEKKEEKQEEETSQSRSAGGVGFGTVPVGNVTLSGTFKVIAGEPVVELIDSGYNIYCETYGQPPSACIIQPGDVDGETGKSPFSQDCESFAEVNFGCFVRVDKVTYASVAFDVAPTLFARVGELVIDIEYDANTGIARGVVDTSSEAYDEEAMVLANTIADPSGLTGSYHLTCADAEGSPERDECDWNGSPQELYFHSYTSEGQAMASLWTNRALRDACVDEEGGGTDLNPNFSINGSPLDISSTAKLRTSLEKAYNGMSKKMKAFITRQAGDDEAYRLGILLDLSLNPLPEDSTMEEHCRPYEHESDFTFNACDLTDPYNPEQYEVCYYATHFVDANRMSIGEDGRLVRGTDPEVEQFPYWEEAEAICPTAYASYVSQIESDPEFDPNSLAGTCLAEFEALDSPIKQADALLSYSNKYDGSYQICKDDARNAEIRAFQANSCMPELQWWQYVDENAEVHMEFACTTGDCFDAEGTYIGALVGGSRNIFKVSSSGIGFNLSRTVDHAVEGYEYGEQPYECKTQETENYSFMPKAEVDAYAVSHSKASIHDCFPTFDQAGHTWQYDGVFTP